MSDTPATDLDRTSRLVEQVLASARDSSLAHFAKGQLLRAQHHCDLAIPEYEIVLAGNRNAVSSIGNIGRCEIYLGQIDNGVSLEERAIRLSPRDPFLAIWYLRIGEAAAIARRRGSRVAQQSP